LYAETAADAVMMAQAPPEKVPTPTRTIKSRTRGKEAAEELQPVAS